MKKILIVGGQESFTKTWAKQHLPDVGLEMAWFWNYERRKLPSFPKSADGVILLKEMCGHRHRNQVVNQAKRWGIPFAEVSHQWLRALPILEQKGLVIPSESSTTDKEKPMQLEKHFTPSTLGVHPDWEEYLDILLLEYDSPIYDEVRQRLSDLIAPYPMTEDIELVIRANVNRKLLTTDKPNPPQPKETTVSNYFNTSMSRAYDIVCEITQSESEAIINFATKCSEKRKPNVPSVVRAIFLEHKVDNPTLFSGVMYHLFKENRCTTTPEIVNKAYERIMGRKHNYTKPREVFAHYDCDWNTHDVSVLADTEATQEFHGQEEVRTDGVQEQITQLTSAVGDLIQTVKHLTQQNALLVEQMKTLTPSTQADPTDSVVIPKSELVEYIINNKLNITIK